jgi:uncharacterized membrane protein (DUF485 family)
MIFAILLYVGFALLATFGASWIAYSERQRVGLAVAVAVGMLLAFAALAAGLVWWLARVMEQTG